MYVSGGSLINNRRNIANLAGRVGSVEKWGVDEALIKLALLNKNNGKVEWVDVVCVKKLAEMVLQRVKPKTSLSVTGRCSSEMIVDKNGKTEVRTFIYATNISSI